MSWIKVNVCLSSLMSEIWNFVFVPVQRVFIRYICLGNEVLSTKLDVHHSDHTWRSWQSSVMRGMCEPDVSAAHWSCSIHVRLSACMNVFIKWSVQQMCAISVMQNIDMLCVRWEMSGRFDSPLTHTSLTIQSWRERPQLKTSII